jgi:hypothetical protein
MGWSNAEDVAFLHSWVPKYGTYDHRCDFVQACQNAYFAAFPYPD